MRDPTWAFVVLTTLQGVQLCVMTWLGIREKACQQKLREMRQEIRSMRRQIRLEGMANRGVIDRLGTAVSSRVPGQDQGKLSDPDASIHDE